MMNEQPKERITVNSALSILNFKHQEIARSANWLRADEVSVALGRSVRAVYALADRHQWPKVRAGIHTYYFRAAIRVYLDGQS